MRYTVNVFGPHFAGMDEAQLQKHIHWHDREQAVNLANFTDLQCDEAENQKWSAQDRSHLHCTTHCTVQLAL